MKGRDTINNNFSFCLLKEGEENKESISVLGMTSSKAYVFNKGRLEKRKSTLVSLFKQLPIGMMVSHGCNGKPWILLRRCKLYKDCTIESVERLAVIGMAMGFIKKVNKDSSVVVMQNVVVDDNEINRFLRMRNFNSK